MTAPFVDLAPLLAPVSAESPTGDWLRYDSLYDQIQELREEDDPTLPQGVWKRELKRADWPAVAELCTEVLARRSKDLQVAVWLTEAWIHLHGFPGLERGLRLLASLCREFWDSLYPPLDDEEESFGMRLGPIAWATEKLLLPIKAVDITAPQGEDARAYTWADWEEGLHLANLSRLNPAAAAKAQEQGRVAQAKILASASLTPADWFGHLAGELAAALGALEELETVLAGHCGEEAPTVGPLREPLAALRAFASQILAERGVPVLSGGPEGPAEEDGGGEKGFSVPPGVISSRAEAYQRLREAADYLIRNEPHSPVPYLVWRAVSWGNLSLAELLQELLQKNADLNTLYTLLGIKQAS